MKLAQFLSTASRHYSQHESTCDVCRALRRIEQALKPYDTDHKETDAVLIDFLTDLRHYAHLEGLDFHAAEKRSYEYYLQEQKEHRRNTKRPQKGGQ